MDDTRQESVVYVSVNELKPHPQQAALYAQPPGKAIEKLAAVIKRDGFNVPVEILPDKTLICGHRRTQAAKLLGMMEIPARVRDDLVTQGEYAVVQRLLEDNETRRHHSPLDCARHALVLKSLAKKRLDSRLSDEEMGEVREHIGRELRMSGRHAGRLIRVAEHAPIEVQAAVDSKQLTMGEAYAVAGLAQSVKDEIARRIRDGQDPKRVVEKFLAPKTGRHKKPRDAKTSFVTALRRGLADLDGRLDRVGWITADEQKTLRDANTVIRRLLAKARRQPTEPPALAKLLGVV